VGLFGIYGLGFGLGAMGFLDIVDLTLGGSVAMQPWFRQRQLPLQDPATPAPEQWLA